MKQTTETPQKFGFEHGRFNPVPARQVYPVYADTFDRYRSAIERGDISLQRVGSGEVCDAIVMLNKEELEGLHPRLLVGSFDEVAAGIPSDETDAFERVVQRKQKLTHCRYFPKISVAPDYGGRHSVKSIQTVLAGLMIRLCMMLPISRSVI